MSVCCIWFLLLFCNALNESYGRQNRVTGIPLHFKRAMTLNLFVFSRQLSVKGRGNGASILVLDKYLPMFTYILNTLFLNHGES